MYKLYNLTMTWTITPVDLQKQTNNKPTPYFAHLWISSASYLLNPGGHPVLLLGYQMCSEEIVENWEQQWESEKNHNWTHICLFNVLSCPNSHLMELLLGPSTRKSWKSHHTNLTNFTTSFHHSVSHRLLCSILTDWWKLCQILWSGDWTNLSNILSCTSH